MFTHDSIAVGEDGATHEPIEQFPSLRAMPGLRYLDRQMPMKQLPLGNWLWNKEAPSVLVLTRQGLPVLKETSNKHEQVAKGAYVLRDGRKAR